MVSVTGLELAYSQAPVSMKSLVMVKLRECFAFSMFLIFLFF